MALKKNAKKATTKPKTSTPPQVAGRKTPSKPKAAVKTVKTAIAKAAPSKTTKLKKVSELTGEQLVIENLATLSTLVRTISETLDVLVQKVENMAYHLIATEETLAEVVATTGVDLAQVNKRIRAKIANGTNKAGDPSRAIDVAAAIASPVPRSRR